MKKRTVLPFAALLALAPFASAQTARPDATQPNATQPIATQPIATQPNAARPSTRPPAQGQRQPGQPVGPGGRPPAFPATAQLTRVVNGLAQLNKDPKTALTKAQAQKLLPILKGLQTAQTLQPAAATSTLTQLEAVLTAAQRSALGALASRHRQDGPDQVGPGGQRPGPRNGQPQANQGQDDRAQDDRAQDDRGQGDGAQNDQAQGGQGQFAQRGPGDPQGNAAGRPARTPGLNPFTQGRGAQALAALITTLTQTAR